MARTTEDGTAIVVHDARTFEAVARVGAKRPSSVFNIGACIPEAGR